MRARSLAGVVLFTALCVMLPVACGSGKHGSSFGQPMGPDSGRGGGDSGGLTGNDGGMLGFGDGGEPPQDSAPMMPLVCDPSCAAAGGTCSSGVCTITENPAGLAAAAQAQLTAGGSADPAFAWLYPYDQTVFPRGLLPPKMQFAGKAADSLYVHITGATLDYTGYLSLSGLGFSLTPAAWTAVGIAAAGGIKVAVTKVSSGAVSGPISEGWTIASGSVRGTIYYETYESTLATSAGGMGGVGIMQIQPGAAQPNVIRAGCGNVCHTASADGSTLVAFQNYSTPFTSAAYDLKTNASQINAAQDQRYTYGGLFPDGSLFMSATNYRTWQGAPSRLYDTATGQPIAAPGWDGMITNAGTAAFSPDGTAMAFVHEDKDMGHSLAMMQFSAATKTFSSLVDLATDPNNVGWPAFTPDSKWVVYQSGALSASEQMAVQLGEGPYPAQFETDLGARADLSIVDVATHTTHRLNALDGYTGAGAMSYLPANDPGLNFAPTILPEAVGGYYWVVFTSHRSYGNAIKSQANTGSGYTDDQGQLWVAAIDVPQSGGEFPPTVTDPSHPAFYLDGQELSADNLRGFWVLPPCKTDGQGCGSGDECCGGYCASAACTTTPPACSMEYDKCTSSSDCCDKSDQCINGRCAQPAN
jgi:hypothetical protein